MFIHNFKYSLRVLLRNKSLIFWTIAFPLILGTFFALAFKDIEKNEKLDIINIAIINNNEFNNNKLYKEAFNTLSDPNNKDRLFNITYTDYLGAKKLLKDKSIEGFIEIKKNKPLITINKNGINETIIKYTTEEIAETKKLVDDLSMYEIDKKIKTGNYQIDYELIYKNVSEMIDSSEIKLKDITKGKLKYTVIEFYSLIAMACLYGGILGAVSINQSLANMSNRGKRLSIAPIGRGKIIISSVLASYLVQLFGLILLFLYTVLVLNVDYGDNLSLIVLLSFAGSLSGLSIGVFVASVFKASENTKTGIILSITLLGCFLSGMMGITMKYIIDKNFKFLNMINPANMITDGFYSLYYYSSYERYITDLCSLFIISFVLLFTSYVFLRRQKYDSI